MSDESVATAQGSSLDRVRAVLAELGCATPTVIATRAELGYSTVPKKLRTLQTNGHVEPVTVDDRTQWRLTDAGRAYHNGAATTPTTSPDDTPTSAAATAAEHPTPGSPNAEPSHTTTPPDTLTPEADTADTSNDTADTSNDLVADDTTAQQTGTAAPDDEPSPESGINPGTDQPTDADTSTAAAASDGHESAGQSTKRSPARRVRKKGALRQEILDLLRARRGTALSTSEICKLIDQANEGNDVSKASAGAVANALDVLVCSGDVTLTKPDTGAARYEAATSPATA